MRRSLVLGLIVCLLGQASWNLRADPQNALVAQDVAATEAKQSEEKAVDDKKDDSKKDEAKTDAAKPDDKKKNIHTLAAFTLDEDLPEGAGIETLFGDTSSTLSSTIESIDAAVADKKIAGIVLSLKSPGIGRGKVEELRAAVARARKAGKKVYALADELSNGDFLLASACDEVILPPSGTVTASGVRAEVTFYKDLFDKLGVKADMLQVGDFKGAAEPFCAQRDERGVSCPVRGADRRLLQPDDRHDRGRSEARPRPRQGPARRGPVHRRRGQGMRADRPSGV